MKAVKRGLLVLCAAMVLAGCSDKSQEEQYKIAQAEKEQREAREKSQNGQEFREKEEAPAKEEKEAAGQKEPGSEKIKGKQKVIVLDPGHSAVIPEGNEPLGPGASEFKPADTSGTSGVVTGVPEYELTLNISVILKKELENRGYMVLMTRETNDVSVSCIQRAETANNAKADAFVRIHANGSEEQSAQGAMTICTTPQSPYVPELYTASRRLSECIINKLCEAAGSENDGVLETDSMSGNNWSKVPAAIVEVGYMTNPGEDMLMQTPEYQEKIAQGIAEGLDAFLGD